MSLAATHGDCTSPHGLGGTNNDSFDQSIGTTCCGCWLQTSARSLATCRSAAEVLPTRGLRWLAPSGMVFTAVAAVAAQLSPSARFTRAVSTAVLGTAFALRAIGIIVARCPGARRQGWSPVRPYESVGGAAAVAGDRGRAYRAGLSITRRLSTDRRTPRRRHRRAHAERAPSGYGGTTRPCCCGPSACACTGW